MRVEHILSTKQKTVFKDKCGYCTDPPHSLCSFCSVIAYKYIWYSRRYFCGKNVQWYIYIYIYVIIWKSSKSYALLCTGHCIENICERKIFSSYTFGLLVRVFASTQ